MRRRRSRSRLFPCGEKRRPFRRRETAGNPDACAAAYLRHGFFQGKSLSTRPGEKPEKALFRQRKRNSFTSRRAAIRGGSGVFYEKAFLKRTTPLPAGIYSGLSPGRSGCPGRRFPAEEVPGARRRKDPAVRKTHGNLRTTAPYMMCFPEGTPGAVTR